MIKITWRVDRDGYAANSEYLGGGRHSAKYRTNRMHRLITQAKRGQIVDHINRNRLDNRKENLRIVTRSENTLNRGANKNNTSGYKGVYWRSDLGKWVSLITFKYKTHCLGFYDSKNEAAKAYNQKATEFFGEGAYLNVITEEE